MFVPALNHHQFACCRFVFMQSPRNADQIARLLCFMFPALHRRFFFLLACFLCQTAAADCVDSIRWSVDPVQCNGLRNGILRIDSVFGGEPPYYFSLDGQSFSTRPTFDRLAAGAYLLRVKDNTGCSKEWVVVVTEPELLQVKLRTTDTLVVSGALFSLLAEVVPQNAPLQSITWRPPDLFTFPNHLVQTLSIHQNTTFAIEIQNDAGCIARDQVTVNVEETNLYFPNIIKPSSNQDAYFTLFAGEGVLRIVMLQIFSRAGDLVFERTTFSPNDPLKGWNGRANGQAVQTGVYPWRAVIEYLDGQVKHFWGTVTVVN